MIRHTALITLLLIPLTLSAGGRPETTTPDPTGVVSDRAEPDDSDEVELVPMDEATAEALFAVGMMPFQERIPSEDFQLRLLDGETASLSDYEGNLVFLNFWATWCPPCREEMPSMQILYDELRAEGLEILAVNVLESPDVAREFIEEMGFDYPVLLDRDGRVMLRYGVRAYPTTYLIDRRGYVIGVRPGFHDWGTDAMIDGMRALLASE